MDITPLVPAGRQVIQGYGDGGFTIADVHWQGSVLVMPTRTLAWPVLSVDEITPANLAEVLTGEDRPDLLVIGCGPTIMPLSREVKAALRAAGVHVEPMDTGAACRTYTVLITEDRRVAAALIAV